MFDNNFRKRGPIFKILSPADSWENSMYTRKDFHITRNMLLHYLVKIENPKMLVILTASLANLVPDNTLSTRFNIWQ